MAKTEIAIARIASEAPQVLGLRNRPRSSSGCSRRDSIAMKAASRSAEPANSPRIRGLPQPSSLPRKSARTSIVIELEGDEAAVVGAPGRRGIARLGHAAGDERRGDQPDRHVDEEDRLPAERLDERAADQRPDRDGGGGRRAPDRERRGALAALVGGGDQGERGGEHRRAAEPLDAAEDVERRPDPRRARRRARRG